MRIAFVPSAPLLLFDAGPPELREAIGAAVDSLTGEVVVVGAAPAGGWWTGSVDRTSYGGPGTPSADPLPLALSVGAHLLRDRPHRLWGVPSGPLPQGDLLVVADGTAKRTLKAPGHLDGRAEAFDEAAAQSLAAGDPAGLAALDAQLAADLWVEGLPAWRAVSELPGPWVAKITYADAPCGVGYFVATWQN